MQKKVSILSARKPWQVVALVFMCGLLIGIVTLVGQATLPGSWNQIANSGAVWLVPTFFIGSLMSSEKYAAAAGIGMLAGTLIGFYATQALLGIALSFYFIALWAGVALVAGSLFGVAGYWWQYERLSRDKRLSRSVVAITLLSGVFVTEGLYYLFFFQYLPQGWGGIIIGILIALLLGRSARERLFAFLLLPLVVLLGIVAYLLINWVGSLNSV